MYLTYYGFTEKPFTITPNPRFIFFSAIHKEAFALLLYGINNHSGFIQLTGEVGTGKTTVLRTLLGQLDEETYRIALIFNPSLTAIDLLRAINREFGIPGSADNVAGLIDDLNRFLLRENASGRTVVLVIDEAQNLAPDVLEQIRMISNLETETDKLIQIILAGQPELGHLLAKPELRQINQRIALRYHLRPLNRNDAAAYIQHRLDIAGGQGKVSFTPSAINWIYRYSRGTPRLINMLCDRALLIGYTENRKSISGRIAASAFRDIMLKRPALFPGASAMGAVVLCSLVIVAFFAYHLLSGAKSGADQRSPRPVTASRTKGAPSPSAFAQMSGAALKQALRADLAVRSEAKSAVQSFNALAQLWHAPPIGNLDGALPVVKELRRQTETRHLEMTAFTGSLDDLVRLDYPALLVISPKEGKETFLVALTGTRADDLLVSPPLLGRTAISRIEFSRFWQGRAYIVWRNSDKIPIPMSRGTRGEKVNSLQGLLRKAGSLELKVNGVYDEATARAVRTFQAARGVRPTGTVGPDTLIRLYKHAEGSSTPRLAQVKETGRQ
jgi:general secretion pathway protein A